MSKNKPNQNSIENYHKGSCVEFFLSKGIPSRNSTHEHLGEMSNVSIKWTKYRQEQNDGIVRKNYIRQYYDLYCLLNTNEEQEFIKTDAYQTHKKVRFPYADYIIPISENEAFLLSDPKQRESLKKRYLATSKLYYKGQPDFEIVLNTIHKYIHLL
jgi:hypothetical protein